MKNQNKSKIETHIKILGILIFILTFAELLIFKFYPDSSLLQIIFVVIVYLFGNFQGCLYSITHP